MTDYFENVRFSAEVSDSFYCCCSGCHRCTRVIKLKLPETFYYDRKTLSTQYSTRWFCRDCADKLLAALVPACSEIRAVEKEDET